MDFSHPLARVAKIWPAVFLSDDSPRNLLAVVTTLELDENKKRYKDDKVRRLKEAAHEWLSFNQDKADGFILLNRLKDW